MQKFDKSSIEIKFWVNHKYVKLKNNSTDCPL